MLSKITLFIFSILSGTVLFAQNTLVLQPGPEDGKDAPVFENLAPNNYGSHPDIISAYWTVQGTPWYSFSFLEFDLSVLPLGATIIDARLSLYHNPTSSNAGHNGNNACNLKRVTSSWDEDVITYNNMPSFTSTGAVMINTSSSLTQDHLDIDVTTFVTDWHNNPSSNHGMMLELIDQQTILTSMLFCSSDHADPTKRPKLEVVYSDVTSVGEITLGNDFQMYPNPASQTVMLDFSEFKNSSTSVSLTDASGKVLHVESVSNELTTIDVSSFEQGVYFVEVISGEGRLVKSLMIQ